MGRVDLRDPSPKCCSAEDCLAQDQGRYAIITSLMTDGACGGVSVLMSVAVLQLHSLLARRGVCMVPCIQGIPHNMQLLATVTPAPLPAAYALVSDWWEVICATLSTIFFSDPIGLFLEPLSCPTLEPPPTIPNTAYLPLVRELACSLARTNPGLPFYVYSRPGDLSPWTEDAVRGFAELRDWPTDLRLPSYTHDGRCVCEPAGMGRGFDKKPTSDATQLQRRPLHDRVGRQAQGEHTREAGGAAGCHIMAALLSASFTHTHSPPRAHSFNRPIIPQHTHTHNPSGSRLTG